MVLKHRRLLLLALFALLSVFVAEALSHTAKAFFFWAFLGLAFIFLLVSFAKRRFFILFLAFLLSAGAFFSSYQLSYRKAIADRLGEEDPQPLSVSISTPTGAYDDIYTAEGLLTLLHEGKPIKLRVKITAPSPMYTGDVLFGEAKFISSEQKGGNSADGFLGTVYFEECRTVDRLTGISYLVGELRSFLTERLYEAVPGEGGALFSALLLGNRAGLSASFTRDMARIGTSHMLSLSGMHLVVLTAGIAFLLKRLRFCKHLRTLLLGFFVVFFMVLTGLSSSVMRAGFMFLLSALPFFLREEKDSFSSLLAAVAVICLFEPYATRDISLWLSSLSTLGILFLFDRMERRENANRSLKTRIFHAVLISLSVTVAATVATLPLTLCIFKTFPLLSPIANLLLSPLVQIALYLSMFAAIFGGFPLLTRISTPICNLIFTIARLLSDIPHSVIPFESSCALIPVFLLFAALLIYYLFCPKRLFRHHIPIAMCLVCALTVGAIESAPRLSHTHELTVSYCGDKENGCDTLLFRYKGERLMAVFSDLSFVGAAEREALALVAGELDGFLLPYYTEDTVKYTEMLLKTYKIHRIYLPVPQEEEERIRYQETVAHATLQGVPTVAFRTDEPFFFEFLTVSHIDADSKSKSPSAHAEFLFGYTRISYFSANAPALDRSTCAMNAELLVFGALGAPPEIYFSKDEFVGNGARILCAAPYILPFTSSEGIVFSPSATVYIPMHTEEP